MEKWKNIDDFGLSEKTKKEMKEDAIVKVKLWESQLSNNKITEIESPEKIVRFLAGAESHKDHGRMQVITFVLGYFNITEKDLGIEKPKVEPKPEPKPKTEKNSRSETHSVNN